MARILVTDDDSLIVDLMKQKLTECGFHTLPAYSGEEALSLVALSLPDLIVLDGNMPGISGFDVLKQLGQNPNTKRIPVIMLTANKNKEAVMQGAAAGVVDYVIKPFSPDELINRITMVIAKRQPTAKKGMEKQETLKAVTANAPGNENAVAEVLLKVLFVDGFETNHNTIQSAMKKHGTFNVAVVATEENTLAQLKDNNPHIIVIDCTHTQLDGYRLAQKIRQYGKEHHLNYIIIGLGDLPKMGDGKKWLVVGMDDYYQKPIAMKSMVNILEKYKERAMDRFI